MMGILMALVCFAVISGILGVVLGFSSKAFEVKEDDQSITCVKLIL